jgi:C1A family cysteine protease
MSTFNRKYNLKPAVLTGNEKLFKLDHHSLKGITLPEKYDLRTVFPECIPPVLDQLQLGACGPNEISNAMRFCLAREKVSIFQPSRLYIYYFTRLFEGSDINQDTGVSISGACGAVSKYSACSENNWGYDITKFTLQPPRNALIAAHTHIPGFKFLQVPQNLTSIKTALVSGFPILIGVQLYSSFESDEVTKTGVVPMPDTKKEQLLGGHCLMIIAYDDKTQTFTGMNSWGGGPNGWGQQGFFTIPYAYILDPNLGGDYCQVRYFK